VRPNRRPYDLISLNLTTKSLDARRDNYGSARKDPLWIARLRTQSRKQFFKFWTVGTGKLGTAVVDVSPKKDEGRQ
jgi:hypothetical protein